MAKLYEKYINITENVITKRLNHLLTIGFYGNKYNYKISKPFVSQKFLDMLMNKKM